MPELKGSIKDSAVEEVIRAAKTWQAARDLYNMAPVQAQKPGSKVRQNLKAAESELSVAISYYESIT